MYASGYNNYIMLFLECTRVRHRPVVEGGGAGLQKNVRRMFNKQVTVLLCTAMRRCFLPVRAVDADSEITTSSNRMPLMT